ncbi:MAG: DNA-directed RNA polymerase subunit beta' [Acidobacteria bacterium]|nr:MAG: DNA-directed RNA polymerase subunit beta' [Acidobacteriota bacterium]
MLDVNNFDTLKIGLATAEQIQMWSNGEVKKPETINYRTLKPEKEGLFCEKIFGPTKDWECYCGKYKRVRFRGIICERCGVEVTRSKVRRERMGHIELAAPVTHIWYFKGVPSRLGYLLNITPKELEKVIYFAASIVTDIDVERRDKDLPELEENLRIELGQIKDEIGERIDERLERLEEEIEAAEERGARESEIDHLRKRAERELQEIREKADRSQEELEEVFDTFRSLSVKQLVEKENIWRELKDRYGEYFDGGMGAKAIRDLISSFDLEAEAAMLRETIETARSQKKQRAIKRLKVVAAFADGRNDPRAMILTAVPVIPPDLRPMVQLDGGRFATSDLNDLYRRVINRNNRLKRLIDLGAPEIIVNNEKRMLQEAVDALFDNGRRGRPVTGPGNRALKSLSDMLKGKQGRFRQNLLGKRVDYSGRSVIVVGPQLELHQCGLPRRMALELFKPFVMKRLVDLELAQNIKSAKRMVERARPQVWDVLEEVIREHPVLLNRAPTLHRLGIQAFEPKLVEGKAIQIHPLVCTAFNADFDGDQMAVHLPLSAEAQAEARILMLSANNVLSPASGQPIVTPTQDMVIGVYYLTEERDGVAEHQGVIANYDELMAAFDSGAIAVHDRIRIRLAGRALGEIGVEQRNGDSPIISTTAGRVLFNATLPPDYPFVNESVRKRLLGVIIDDLAGRYSKAQLARTLDGIKDLGFRFATQSGLTISVEDVKTPPGKPEILEGYEVRADKVQQDYANGVIVESERRAELIEIWTAATTEVQQAMEKVLAEDSFNPLNMMVGSGARGNITQVRQLAGMRGLVSNPKGEIIPRPIKANYREGLSVLEYFISTHGARKGLADTALRTADSGYLTRRLVDVSQEVIVREVDCNTSRGIVLETYSERPEMRIFGRTLAEDVVDPKDKKNVIKAGTDIDKAVMAQILEMADLREERGSQVARGLQQITVRSVVTCDSRYGVCASCYGRSLATGEPVNLGEAVGIMAAQSIGEPGTQLTMRTFHTGGVHHAAGDITHGLPRVVELFEARTPKGKATISRYAGKIKIEKDDEGGQIVKVIPELKDDPEEEYPVTRRQALVVKDGDTIAAGDQITEGSRDPKEILEIQGQRKVEEFLVEEVQKVYRSQGVPIHDKHIELIVRQMLRKVVIQESGDTDFLPGDRIDSKAFRDENRRVIEDGGEPAVGRADLMGITKASLATDSWLSAASFQETTRVLTEAAITGRTDKLIGLKENVIIGKLIPAGTGTNRYRAVKVLAPEAPVITSAPFYSMEEESEDGIGFDAAEWLAKIGGEEDLEPGEGDEISDEPSSGELTGIAVIEESAPEESVEDEAG